MESNIYLADLLTKNLPSGEKRTTFCKMLLHHLNPSIEIEKLSEKAAAAAAVELLPGQWIEVIIGVVEF